MRKLFHDGELAVQQATGQTMRAVQVGREIGARIPPGAFGFIQQQTLAAVTVVDSQGGPWSEILLGPPGFATASTSSVTLDLNQGYSPLGNAWLDQLDDDPRLGMLFIELSTRRRLRVNGRARRQGTSLQVSVVEAYGNCPKYIQRWRSTPESEAPTPCRPVAEGSILGSDERAVLRRTDTAFVASDAPEGLPDASHRGGHPGFMTVFGERTIRVPDYVGNSMFNTLGNFHDQPLGGITAVDFEQRQVLQVTGTVTLVLEGMDDSPTGRGWELSVSRWRRAELPETQSWELLDRSPDNPSVLP